MKVKIVQSIHGANFVVIEPKIEHLTVLLWLVSTRLEDLKTVKSGLCNTVAGIERHLPFGSFIPATKGRYWTNSWIWTSYLSQNSGKLTATFSKDYFHFPFDGDIYDIPPIPKFLFSLWVLENRDKVDFSILEEELPEKDKK